MGTPASLEAFTQEVREIVEARGRAHHDPDDDWSPMGAFAGSGGLAAVLFDPGLLREESDKDLLVVELAALAATHRARYVAFALSSWMSLGPPTQRRPADDPARIEALALYLGEMPEGGRDATAVRVSVSYARIERRRGRPPRLGAWQEIARPGQRAGGRFHDAVVIALTLGTVFDELEGFADALGLGVEERHHQVRRAVARIVGLDPDRLPRHIRSPDGTRGRTS